MNNKIKSTKGNYCYCPICIAIGVIIAGFADLIFILKFWARKK